MAHTTAVIVSKQFELHQYVYGGMQQWSSVIDTALISLLVDTGVGRSSVESRGVAGRVQWWGTPVSRMRASKFPARARVGLLSSGARELTPADRRHQAGRYAIDTSSTYLRTYVI